MIISISFIWLDLLFGQITRDWYYEASIMASGDHYLYNKSENLCWGVVYRVPGDARGAVLAGLDARESGGFDRCNVEATLTRNPDAIVPALTYIAPPGNPNFLGPAPNGEIARQVRLRDLGGVVIIDFIDMEDMKLRAKVENAKASVSKEKFDFQTFATLYDVSQDYGSQPLTAEVMERYEEEYYLGPIEAKTIREFAARKEELKLHDAG